MPTWWSSPAAYGRPTARLVRAGGGDDAAAEAFVIDSPVFPDELEVLPALLDPGRVPAQRPAGHPRRLGPPARRLAFPRRRWAAAGHRPRLSANRGPRSVRCASSTTSTTSSAPAAGARSGAGAPGARPLDDRRPRDRADRGRGTPATGWRCGSAGRGVLVAGDYLSAVEIPSSAAGLGPAILDTLDRLGDRRRSGDARRARSWPGAGLRARAGGARGRRAYLEGAARQRRLGGAAPAAGQRSAQRAAPRRERGPERRRARAAVDLAGRR